LNAPYDGDSVYVYADLTVQPDAIESPGAVAAGEWVIRAVTADNPSGADISATLVHCETPGGTAIVQRATVRGFFTVPEDNLGADVLFRVYHRRAPRVSDAAVNGLVHLLNPCVVEVHQVRY
jgi:hypothetical protein